MITIWIILGVIGIVALVVTFFGGRNSVWGGLTLGVIVGLIIALVYLFADKGFEWLILVKGGIVGTIAGAIFSFIGQKPHKQ